MKIILEGPDNSGKSTLAALLSLRLSLPIIHSGGPSKYPGEVNERARRFNRDSRSAIYDRHPCVSQNIYQEGLGLEGEIVREDSIQEFYSEKPIIIYCRNSGTLQGHVLSEYSDEEYFRKVERSHSRLCQLYDDWALKHAHHIYRIGDDMNLLVRQLGSVTFDPVDDIDDFHRQFDLAYGGPPRLLPLELSDFRQGFMEEEMSEYSVASTLGRLSLETGTRDPADITFHLETQLDSLVDLVYVALGTSHLHGFDFREAWRRVHRANMSKVRAMRDGVEAEGVTDSGREKEFDIVKPEGWQAPSHTDLVEWHAHRKE